VDTNVFVVLPFVVRGPPSVEYLGPSMVDLLHMALDGVGKMRIEYAPTTLRRLSQLSEPQQARSASGVALEIGAGRVIAGTIVALGTDIRIRAEVFDAIRGRPQFVVEGRANITNVSAVVDTLASQVLARRLVPSAERVRLTVGEYATKSPKALQAYLVARQHARRGERRLVADSLKSALRLDPQFGLAHLLLHRTESAQNSVTGMSGDSILRAARAHIASFPERLRFMFDDARGSGDRFRRFEWAKAAVARFPNDPDAAFYLADAYFHVGHNLGESRGAGAAAFRRAIALDDQDPELLQHFQALMMEAGDSTASREAYERCHAIAPDICRDDLDFRALFRREDPLALAAGADSLFWGAAGNFLLRATPWDPAFGLALTDSFAKVQTRLGRSAARRGNAYVVRSSVALARGQYDLAWSFLDSAAAADRPRAGFLALHHVVTGTHEREATAFRPSPPDFPMVVIVAWSSAARLAPDSAEVFLRMLETGPWPDSAMSTAIATGLRGLVALRAGDTTKALERLTRVRSRNTQSTGPQRTFFPGAAFALLHAQIEAARGNHARAKLLLADVYPMNDYVPFIGDAEELRASVALALADTATARTHLRNLTAVWANPDPPLQPRVAAARALLARLEGR